MSEAKRLFVIEDEVVLSDLLAEFLQIVPGVEFVGQAYDGKVAMEKCLELKPDIVILDIRLPEVNGLEVLTLLNHKLPGTRSIIFSGTIKEESIRIALKHGAFAYVEKTYGLEELQKAIESVIDGRKYFSPGIQKLITNFEF